MGSCKGGAQKTTSALCRGAGRRQPYIKVGTRCQFQTSSAEACFPLTVLLVPSRVCRLGFAKPCSSRTRQRLFDSRRIRRLSFATAYPHCSQPRVQCNHKSPGLSSTTGASSRCEAPASRRRRASSCWRLEAGASKTPCPSRAWERENPTLPRPSAPRRPLGPSGQAQHETRSRPACPSGGGTREWQNDSSAGRSRSRLRA